MDLHARTRCHCIYQILTFINFHIHFIHDDEKEFETIRKHVREKQQLREMEELKCYCWKLLKIANLRVLDKTELAEISTLEEQITEIVHEFQLINNNYLKCLLTNETFCVSLPSLVGTHSLDDDLVVRQRASILKSKSEKDVLKPKRRASVCDYT